MGFIHYNSLEEPLLLNDQSFDDMDFGVLAIEYGGCK